MSLILHIFYNAHGDAKPHYGVSVLDKSGDLIDRYDLKRKPTASKFDRVMECGCGADGVKHLTWCTRQQRVYRHPLLKCGGAQ